MSEANQVSVKYVVEGTYGSSPAAGTWQKLRFTSQDIAAAPQTVISSEIRDDRQVSDLAVVGSQVGGSLGFEFSAATFDELMEAAFMGTWATNTLEPGTTARGFSVEVGFEDWSPPHYLQYKGMRVGSMSLNFAYGALATGSIAFVGKEALESATSLVGAGSTTAATATEVFNGSDQISNILIDAGAIGVSVKSLSINIENNMRPEEGMGAAGPSNQKAGRCMVTGSIEAYFDTIGLYQKLIGNTAFALEFTVTDDAGNAYNFDMQNVKFNDGNPGVSGVDTDVMLTLNYTALFDVAADTNILVDRTVV